MNENESAEVNCRGCVCICTSRTNKTEQELTPLVRSRQRRNYDKFFFLLLIIMLLIGTSIGTYLLYREDTLDPPEEFSLIPREIWKAQTVSSVEDMTPLTLPSQTILFLQTNTTTCTYSFECAELVRTLQIQHMTEMQKPDIMYNFLVAGDGRIYEGRGWSYQSGYDDSDRNEIVIAFLGSFDYTPPSNKQKNAAKAFLDYSVMKRKIIPCYDIIVRQQVMRYLLDIATDIKENARLDIACT